MAKELIVKVPTIYMDGGVIQGVEKFPPNSAFDIIDYDTQDSDPADLCDCLAGSEPHHHSKRVTDGHGRE